MSSSSSQGLQREKGKLRKRKRRLSYLSEISESEDSEVVYESDVEMDDTEFVDEWSFLQDTLEKINQDNEERPTMSDIMEIMDDSELSNQQRGVDYISPVLKEPAKGNPDLKQDDFLSECGGEIKLKSPRRNESQVLSHSSHAKDLTPGYSTSMQQVSGEQDSHKEFSRSVAFANTNEPTRDVLPADYNPCEKPKRKAGVDATIMAELKWLRQQGFFNC